jgi:nitrile hydratase accessory protein
MFTRFEDFAAAQMLGHADSPPRSHGKLNFTQDWQRTLFGLALAASKEGHFEWEDFRKNLIQSIGAWESMDCEDQPPWDYYERFLLALTRVLQEHDVLSAAEISNSLSDTNLN